MSEGFDLLRNVTIGQYIPTGSIVHQLDPRAKLLAAGLFVVAITIANTVVTGLMVLAILLLIARLARIPIPYVLRGLLPMLPFLIFIFALQILFRGQADITGRILFEWWFIRVTDNSLRLIVIALARIMAFVFLASLLTLTTSTTQLTHGMEYLLSPFRPLGVPAHELALVWTIALRFVPTLAGEVDQVAKAQASRCGNVGERNRWRPDKVVRARLPLIVPLFLTALRRGEDLILAMEARCYVSGERRTRLVQFQSRPLDFAIVVLVAVVVVIVWWIGSRSI